MSQVQAQPYISKSQIQNDDVWEYMAQIEAPSTPWLSEMCLKS